MKFNTMTPDGFKEIEGKMLKSEQFPSFDFYSYVDENGAWWICELVSGFAAGGGLTLGEAKKTASKNILEAGNEKFKRLVEETIKENGQANESIRKEAP